MTDRPGRSDAGSSSVAPSANGLTAPRLDARSTPRCLRSFVPVITLCAIVLSGGVLPREVSLSAIAAQGAPPAQADDPLAADRAADGLPKMLRVSLAGPLNANGVEKTMRDTRKHLNESPDTLYVLFVIDTNGDDFDAARTLAAFVHDELKGKTTLAFVPPGGAALAGGALVALSCNEIVMARDAVLGAKLGLKPSEEQGEDVTRAFKKYASSRRYPSLLAAAMVTKTKSDILLVRHYEPGPGGEDVETTTFMTPKGLQVKKREDKLRPNGEPQLVLQAGDFAVFSADEALDYRIATHLADDLDELKAATQITIPDEHVIDARTGGALRPASPGAQGLIDFLNHPITRSLLLLGGCLGLLLELKMFGTMIPGIVGFICLGLFFIAALFPVTGQVAGTASGFEITLFIIGLVLIGFELGFPGLAIFAISGVALCSTSIVLAMIPGETGGASQEGAFQSAITILLLSFAGGISLFFAVIHYLPKLPMKHRGGLVSDTAIVGVPTADSSLDAQARTRELIGASGTATTALRPAGKVSLADGRLVDVVTEGGFIERGATVEILEIAGSRIVVGERSTGSST